MPLLGETRCRGYRVCCGGAERALVAVVVPQCVLLRTISNAARFINAALEF